MTQSLRGVVGLAGIEDQAPLEADDPCNGVCELEVRAVKASADIDVREHGFDMRLPDISRQVHHVNACSGQVVNVEELTHGFATAPDHDVLGIRLHGFRSEEHTSELQSLMRISYAVFCLKKKTHNNHT